MIVEPTSGNTGRGSRHRRSRPEYNCVRGRSRQGVAGKDQSVASIRSRGVRAWPHHRGAGASRLVLLGSPTDWPTEIPGRLSTPTSTLNPATHWHTNKRPVRRYGSRQRDASPTSWPALARRNDLGIARYLKQQNPNVEVVGADPVGCVLGRGGPSLLVEGIGEDFWPVSSTDVVDPGHGLGPRLVPRSPGDPHRGPVRGGRRASRCRRTRGRCGLGPDDVWSSSSRLGPRLPVEGVQRLLVPDYGFLERPGTRARIGEVQQAKLRHGPGGAGPDLVIGTHEKVGRAIDTPPSSTGSRRRPVSRSDAPGDLSEIVGSINERSLLDRVFRDGDAVERDVAEVMGPPLPVVQRSSGVEEMFEDLSRGRRGRDRGRRLATGRGADQGRPARVPGPQRPLKAPRDRSPQPRACARSAIRSSGCSIPTESRTRVAGTSIPIPPGRRGSCGPDARSAIQPRPATRRGRRRGCPRRREARSPRTRSRTRPCPRKAAPPRRHLVAGRARWPGKSSKPRVVDALRRPDARPGRPRPAQRWRNAAASGREGLQPAEEEEAVERTRHRPRRVLEKVQLAPPPRRWSGHAPPPCRCGRQVLGRL